MGGDQMDWVLAILIALILLDLGSRLRSAYRILRKS